MDDQEYTGLYSYRLISCVDAITNHAQNIYQSTIADEKHLEAQMHHRTVSFAPDSFSDQIKRKKNSHLKTFKTLHVDSHHAGCQIVLKITSFPIYNEASICVNVKDQNDISLPLYMYNWASIVDAQSTGKQEYSEKCLDRLLTPGSNIILFNPWLTKTADGRKILCCVSPNTNLCLVDFEKRCRNYMHIDIDQLIRWSDQSSAAGDHLSAIKYLNDGFKQIDKKADVDFFWKEHSRGKNQGYRILLLHKRCVCYLKAGEIRLAFDDLKSLCSFDRLPLSTMAQLTKLARDIFLRLGRFEEAKYWINLEFIDLVLTTTLKELVRLENELNGGQYDLHAMLQRDQFFPLFNDSSSSLFHLQYYHIPKHRDDLFEVRRCSQEEILTKGYPEGSFGVYASTDLKAGTLLVVEAPFACINNRSYLHPYMNEKDAKMISLANEIEKRLSTGIRDPNTLEELKQIQPIRNWFEQNNTESFFPGDPSEEPFFTEVQKPSLMPYSLLCKAQQQNPFYSKSTTGLYPNGSMFNHSCLPNCIWFISDNYLFISTGQSIIKEGEELTISYCPLWRSSVGERASRLQEFGIEECQCELCSYDRLRMKKSEDQLKNFHRLCNAAERKNLSLEERFAYVLQLWEIYNSLSIEYGERPVGFSAEFIRLEYLIKSFEGDINPRRRMFYQKHQRSFLERFSNLTRFLTDDAPEKTNPMLLFGKHLPLLLVHIKDFFSEIHSNDLELWQNILEQLYEVITFNSCSPVGQMEGLLKNHRDFFRNLDSTQIIFN